VIEYVYFEVKRKSYAETVRHSIWNNHYL